MYLKYLVHFENNTLSRDLLCHKIRVYDLEHYRITYFLHTSFLSHQVPLPWNTFSTPLISELTR